MSLKGDIVNGFMRRMGLEIRRYQPEFVPGMVTLKPDRPVEGIVLLAYILEPFMCRPGEAISNQHNHHQESILMAQVWLDKGFAVDVIDFRNDQFVPQKRYDYFVSARVYMEVIAKRLNADCTTIAHFDTSHYSFNNQATYARLREFQRRKGVSVPRSVRIVERNSALEIADYGVVLGNEHTADTYRYMDKRLFMLPAVTNVMMPFNVDKDYRRCRNRFIWLGSNGLVHKGLDTVLEAFAEMPDMHLTVCGPVDRETVFCDAYQRELRELPNIEVAGWVEMPSERFKIIAAEHVAVVYPSCAEGQATAVLNAMGGGMIPAVSYSAGISVGDFGYILEGISAACVREVVREIAALPIEAIRQRTKDTWEYTQTRHSHDAYKMQYSKIIHEINQLEEAKH